VDKNTVAGKYFYRLKQIDFDGSFEYSNEIMVDAIGRLTFALAQNYPNPFNPETTIEYSIADKGLVTIKIYDLLGREITTLVNEIKKAGTYRITFNASNLSSGIYFYVLNAGGKSISRKMSILK
jgi:hypothetical protein